MPTANRPFALALLAGLILAIGARQPAPAEAQTPLPEGYRLVATWKTTAPSSAFPQMDRPLGIDVADDNTIYVADSRRNQVYHLNDQGGRITDWSDGSIGSLVDIVASSDRVYILGQTAGVIRRRDGTLVKPWPVAGGQGVAFGPDRRVYVSRVVQGRGVIEVYDVDGNKLETWKDDNYSILSAYGLDVGSDGRVYLAADGAVYIFSPNGSGGGRVTAALRLPRGIEGAIVVDVAFDTAARIYATVESGYMVVWNGTTPTQKQIDGVKRLAVGPGGGMVFTVDDGTFRGLSHMPDRSKLQDALVQWGAKKDETLGQIDVPRRAAVATTGDVFLLDSLQRVQRWSSAGLPQEQWPVAEYMVDVAGGANRPCYITGRQIRCIVSASPLDWFIEVPPTGWLNALDGDASRLAALDLADQKVWLYGRDKTLEDSWPLPIDPGDTRFRAISDIATSGNLVYLADQGGNRIDIRNLDGSQNSILDLPTGPVRVSVVAGDIYVLGSDGWIWKYGSDKKLKAVWQPAADGGTPNDIAAEAGGRVYVTDPKNDRVLVYAPGGTPGTVPARVDERCLVTVDKRAAPPEVLQGELATIQLTVKGACPLGDGRLDVVLVIDQSGSMQGSAMAAAQTAALAFLNELNPAGAQVGVVGFSNGAEVHQPLGSDLSGAVRAIAGLVASGQTDYLSALEKARSEATGPASRPDVPHVVVMMTDGRPTTRQGVEDKATELKRAGVTLFTIGFGTTIDPELLKIMASSPDLYFDAPSEAELADVYREVARRITSARLLKTATVTDELPADMVYENGSAVPPARINGRTLTWELTNVPATGRTLSFRVRAKQTGRRPTNVRAVVDYIDASDQPGQLIFPVPQITVLRPSIWYSYLPILYKNQCKPQRADVILTMDSSLSMTEPERPGSLTTKLQAAVRSARSFIDAMGFPGDQAAIVQFNGSARLVEPLTGSRPALNFALNNLTTASGTRIDLGLQAATRELIGSRRIRGNNPVIVLLTDGQPTEGSANAALTAARDARSLGFTLFAVGLGDDAELTFLQQLAGRRDRAFLAPDAASLALIYERIAGKVLCEP